MWGVTGYKVERCQGAGCTSFAQIGTAPVGTTYSDTGLLANTTYLYRVRATGCSWQPQRLFKHGQRNNTDRTASGYQVCAGQLRHSTVDLGHSHGDLHGRARCGRSECRHRRLERHHFNRQSVTDTLGNNYALAVGPTAVSGFLSQSIYYLKNIARRCRKQHRHSYVQ